MSIVHPTTAPPTFDTRCLESVFIVENPAQEWPEIFAIITAYNGVDSVQEEGQPSSEEIAEDDAGNNRLLRLLREQGFDPFPVTGASPDHSHQEPGFGFGTRDLALACRTARSFDQWGFFWVQHGEVYICTDDAGTGWYIGDWRSRLRPST